MPGPGDKKKAAAKTVAQQKVAAIRAGLDQNRKTQPQSIKERQKADNALIKQARAAGMTPKDYAKKYGK